jgi:hypothetical protein
VVGHGQVGHVSPGVAQRGQFPVKHSTRLQQQK